MIGTMIEIAVLTFICIFGGSILALILNKRVSKSKTFPPGPVSLPFIGSVYALGKDPHKKLTELKKTYGNVIAIDFGSYRGIVLNDYDTIKKAFSLPEIQNRPNFEATQPFRGDIRTGILWSSGKTNQEQRAFILKTLKTFGVGKKKIEVLLQEQLGRLFKTFDRQAGNVIVNYELFNTTAISALWTIISGERGREEDENFKTILSATKRMAKGSNNNVYFFPTLSKLFPNISGWNNFVKSATLQTSFVAKTIELHKDYLKADEEPRDIIEALLQKYKTTNDTNSTFYGEIGEKNVLSTVGDLLQAGTETVSTVLTWLLALLIRFPEIQNKIHLEIDKVIGPDRLPSLADRQQLPYVESVIFEIFRYTAFAPLGVPHETSEDVEIDGYTIAKNTVVISNVYDTLYDPQHWEEPEEFKPERFLNEDATQIQRNISNKIDLIFGHGRRICPGETLAKDELFIFITGLCQRYTFKPDPDSHYEKYVQSDFSVTIVPKPHNLIIYKR